MGEQLDNATSTLVEQIGSCGQSLLEIIDHLLEFLSKESEAHQRRSEKLKDWPQVPGIK